MAHYKFRQEIGERIIKRRKEDYKLVRYFLYMGIWSLVMFVVSWEPMTLGLFLFMLVMANVIVLMPMLTIEDVYPNGEDHGRIDAEL